LRAPPLPTGEGSADRLRGRQRPGSSRRRPRRVRPRVPARQGRREGRLAVDSDRLRTPPIGAAAIPAVLRDPVQEESLQIETTPVAVAEPLPRPSPAPSTAGAMIVFENVTKVYDPDVVALRDVSFVIEKGEFVFIVGASGSGKSTIIRLLLKELEPTRGRILVGGRDLARLKRSRVPLLRRNLGCVFQDFKLLPNRTAAENVAYALKVQGERPQAIRKKVPEALSLVGLAHKATSLPDELSGGEQRRVSIARAVVNHPPLLICDEPTGNLDPDTSVGIMQLLYRINRAGTTVLMVTHDREMVDKMRKRVIALDERRLARDDDGPRRPVRARHDDRARHLGALLPRPHQEAAARQGLLPARRDAQADQRDRRAVRPEGQPARQEDRLRPEGGGTAPDEEAHAGVLQGRPLVQPVARRLRDHAEERRVRHAHQRAAEAGSAGRRRGQQRREDLETRAARRGGDLDRLPRRRDPARDRVDDADREHDQALDLLAAPRDRGDEARRRDELVRPRPVHGRGPALRARGRRRRGDPAGHRQGSGLAVDRHRALEGRPRDAVRAERPDPDRHRPSPRRLRYGADAAPLPAGLAGPTHDPTGAPRLREGVALSARLRRQASQTRHRFLA